jgi:CubicO group peptidase (beta-lactamase class C family)
MPLRQRHGHVRGIALIFGVLCCRGLAPSAIAQDQKLSNEKRTAIEAAVAKFMASTHVPGVSVAVVENGEYEWASGFGLDDVENNSPASEEHTLYRLGSISKSLTATGAMELWARGQLDLDVPDELADEILKVLVGKSGNASKN